MQKLLYSIGQLARECGVQVHIVRYCLRSRRIEPIERVGRIDIYDEAALIRLRSELARMASAKACR